MDGMERSTCLLRVTYKERFRKLKGNRSIHDTLLSVKSGKMDLMADHEFVAERRS